MTVPTGPASLADIQAEFGGANPISLSEYWAGNGYTPSPPPTSIHQTGPIPIGGAISIGNFLGVANAPPQQITWSGSEIYSAYAVSPATAQVFLYMTPNGTYNETPDSIEGNWLTPTQNDIGASYWIKYTVVSGNTTFNTSPSMTAGTWYSLSTVRRYGIGQGNVGSGEVTVNISISSSASDAGIVGTKQITFSGTVDTDVGGGA